VVGGPTTEATSGVGRVLSRDAALDAYKIEQEIRRLEREKLSVTPGSFEATYPVERREAAAKAATIDEQVAAKQLERATLRGTEQAAAAPGQTVPAQPGQTAPGAAKAPPPPSTGTQQAIDPAATLFGRKDVGETGGTPDIPPPKKTNVVPPKNAPKTNGPATTGNNTPGGSPGANQPAPPRGASQPYTAQTAPKGSLGDQTRTAAFDPTGTVMPGDPTDSRNVFAVDTTGRSREATGAPTPLYTNQDIHTTMQGAMSEAPKNGRAPVPGEGAASRPVFNAFVQAHNQGGKLEPGDALLVGMVGRYKELLRQGRQKEASVAAWGLIQAANLEAATRGRTALDQIRSGDRNGALKTATDGLGYLPDGMQHKPSPDGQSILTIDPRTGQVTATTPMNGQSILALAMGLSDGSMLWGALQGSVASLTPPDKDAANRARRGQLLDEQIIGARQRNARGVGGGKASPVSGNASAADALLGQYGPQVAASSGPRPSSGSYLSPDYVPPEPGEGNG
jgi:hypothetical protein